MNWYWHIPIYAAAVYMTLGAYVGWMWTRGASFSGISERLFFSFMMMFLWIFFFEDGDSKYLDPPKKTKQSRALKTERIRMNAELAVEIAQVELLEASGAHRKAMAELHERRTRAEAIE